MKLHQAKKRLYEINGPTGPRCLFINQDWIHQPGFININQASTRILFIKIKTLDLSISTRHFSTAVAPLLHHHGNRRSRWSMVGSSHHLCVVESHELKKTSGADELEIQLEINLSMGHVWLVVSNMVNGWLMVV